MDVRNLTSLVGKIGADPGQGGKVSATDREKIHELSQDFEAIFVEMMLKSMRNSVQKSGLNDGGNAEEIFRTMLDSEYAKIMAKEGSGGIANNLEKQLLKTIEIQSGMATKQKALEIYQGNNLQDSLIRAKIKG